MNGREKKIAIVENERVTEFYIERGSEDQGIVGNLYKGRVMRVLPGMQSRLWIIGLERDAFLYVSDFFDEEAEFERIVVDTGQEGRRRYGATGRPPSTSSNRASSASGISKRVTSALNRCASWRAPKLLPSKPPPSPPPSPKRNRPGKRKSAGADRRGGRRSRPEKSEAPRAETEAIENAVSFPRPGHSSASAMTKSASRTAKCSRTRACRNASWTKCMRGNSILTVWRTPESDRFCQSPVDVRVLLSELRTAIRNPEFELVARRKSWRPTSAISPMKSPTKVRADLPFNE